jgi:hypothetical protein
VHAKILLQTNNLLLGGKGSTKGLYFGPKLFDLKRIYNNYLHPKKYGEFLLL